MRPILSEINSFDAGGFPKVALGHLISEANDDKQLTKGSGKAYSGVPQAPLRSNAALSGCGTIVCFERRACTAVRLNA